MDRGDYPRPILCRLGIHRRRFISLYVKLCTRCGGALEHFGTGRRG